MAPRLKRVAILGAGVMGSGIAAHLASAGVRSLMLDIVPRDPSEEEKKKGLTTADREVRNRFSAGGKEAAIKAKPALFLTPRDAGLIEVGNFDDDFPKIKDCDWIVEVVKEDLDVKRAIFEKVDRFRKPGSMVTSNTSGLSIAGMVEGRTPDFRRNFLVTHFFNPVRYMKLLEIVPGAETDPAVVQRAVAIGEELLGKGIVYGKDTPNFVANRIGIYAMMYTLQAMREFGFSIEEIDAIAGPPMGKPKSAVFRTADLVGLDTLVHVAQNCYDSLTHDEEREIFIVPQYLKDMVQKGWLGNKTKGGFYKKGPDGLMALDLEKLEYRPQAKPKLEAVGATKGVDDAGKRIATLVSYNDKVGQFSWKVLAHTLCYAARRLGEIADDVVNIDNAMKWGFNWDKGPFETWDAIGVRTSVERMKKDGIEVPKNALEMLAAGRETFYAGTASAPNFYDFVKKDVLAVAADPKAIGLKALREQKKVVKENGGATIFDIGDGVYLLEFHTKMNAIDPDIISMMNEAVDLAEAKGTGVVISNEAPDGFSVGANLFLIAMAIGQQQWPMVEKIVRDFQAACMKLRYSDVPVVAAPFGLALGGGAEVAMGADAIRAHCELYMGLVEVGVGLIPGGGGTVDMLGRVMTGAPDDPGFDPMPLVRRAFEAIGMAKVSFSAEEARGLGFLRESDAVGLNRSHLFHQAKETVLGMARAGYRRPRPKTFRLPGENGAAVIEWYLYNMKMAGYISEHDALIGTKLARVLTGGSTSTQIQVSEQHILDLECEAFLSLCGQPKSFDRIQYMLQNGKPLRN